ncbi:hypothetical protein [Companilactobacillus tucceti]|uniref:hypothetical protein n=1 Tax=Companilactobacillus tucceti TaxID=238012 RepID=UPI0012ECDDAC|nr:hypothetical protein [Companilactobacillus tucceti]
MREVQKSSCAVRPEIHRPNITFTAAQFSCSFRLGYFLFLLSHEKITKLEKKLKAFINSSDVLANDTKVEMAPNIDGTNIQDTSVFGRSSFEDLFLI